MLHLTSFKHNNNWWRPIISRYDNKKLVGGNQIYTLESFLFVIIIIIIIIIIIQQIRAKTKYGQNNSVIRHQYQTDIPR